EQLYRGTRPAPAVRGRTVLVVDDGLATGATMRAAVAALRQQEPGRLVVAVPTAAAATCEELHAEVDDVVSVLTPEPFYAVGLWAAPREAPGLRQVRRARPLRRHVGRLLINAGETLAR